jgi:hypothetical protein
MNRSDTGYLFFNVFSPILIGGTIYTVYRDKNILLFEWFEQLGVLDFFLDLRLCINPNYSTVSNIFTQNLPDGLWVYSFTSCLLFIWGESKTVYHKMYILIPIIFATVSELGQLYELIAGTFDPIDLFFYFFFAYLAKIIYKVIL